MPQAPVGDDHVNAPPRETSQIRIHAAGEYTMKLVMPRNIFGLYVPENSPNTERDMRDGELRLPIAPYRDR